MAKAKKTTVLTAEERLEQALVPEAERPYPVPENWYWTRFFTVLNYEQPTNYIVESTEYKDEYSIPVLTAGKSFILGYTDETLGICNGLPVIIFDDFTTDSKFVNFPFKVKSSAMKILRPATEIKLGFIYYYMQTVDCDNSEHRRFWISTYSQLPFPIPPLDEQQRIVDRIESLFAKLDEAKEKAQAALDSFETRKAAILHKAFTGELTAKWRKENGIRLESWEEVIALNCLLSKPRNGYSPSPVSYPTKVKSLTLSATTSGEFKPEYFKYIDEKITDDSYLWLKTNDILIQRANSLEKVGSSAIYLGSDNEFIYPDLMMKLQVNNTMFPKFLAYQLKTNRVMDYLRNNATGTAGNMPKINQKVVSNIPLYRPTMHEQTEIISILDSFFAKEQKAKELCSVLDKIDLIKKSILARAFRGELGTNDPTEESALELLKSIV